MNRHDNIRYNPLLLSDVCEIVDVRVPILPARTISTIDIGSRHDEIYNGKNIIYAK